MAFLGLLGRPAAAGVFDFKDETWEGTSELLAVARKVAGPARVRVSATIPWDELQPRDALLILHPTRELDPREASAFLAAGGRIGLLDDYGKGDALLDRFRIHRVRGPLFPADTLRGNENLPIAVPTLDATGSRHPMLAGVDRVIANHPTALATEKGLRLTTVLEIRSTSEEPATLALVGVIGDARGCGLAGETPASGSRSTGRCGRLFAMGDPSAVMNLMLRYPGNRRFAESLVQYLLEDDSWGPRGGTLHLIANDFAESGSFGNRGGLGGALEDRAEAVGHLVDEIRRDGLPKLVAWVLAILSGALTLLFIVPGATQRYRRALPRFARPTDPVAQGGLAGRAALLSSPATHPALSVLELKSALEEILRDRLGISPLSSQTDILKEIDRQDALGRRNSGALKSLFDQMSRAESAVIRTEPIRIPEARVRRMHEDVRAILSELDARLRKEP